MRYLRIIKESPANALIINDNEIKILTDHNSISLKFKDYRIYIEFYDDAKYCYFDLWLISHTEDGDGWKVDFTDLNIENNLFRICISKIKE